MVERKADSAEKGAAVVMRLKPDRPRQLGDEGLVVYWREAVEPGRYDGLVCFFSACPNPNCSCRTVDVTCLAITDECVVARVDEDGFHLEWSEDVEASRATPSEKFVAAVDPCTGEILAHPEFEENKDSAVMDWLTEEMDGELLETLYRFRVFAKGEPPERPRKDIDLDEVEKYHVAWVSDLIDNTRPDEYILGDHQYWTSIRLCPIPWCDCHEAQVVFFVQEAEPGSDAVGRILLAFGMPVGYTISEMESECGCEHLLKDLWGLFERRHDVGTLLRQREAQMRAVGETLWFRAERTAPGARKVGRNAPCPCGSGRKYKKCCLGKDEGWSSTDEIE